MYVIFPADELISMTYGIAVPRFKQRPTLDNLRDPLITDVNSTSIPKSSPQQPSPLLSRPPPSPSKLVSAVSKQLQNHLQQIEKDYQVPPKESLSRQPSRHSKTSQTSNTKTTPTRVQPTTPLRTVSREPSFNKATTIVASPNKEQSQKFHNSYQNDRMTGSQEDERYMRERSPSLIIDHPIPDSHRPPQHPTAGAISKSTPSTPKPTQSKSKLRPKLNISLGRLGRSQPEQPERYRLREDQEIHVENPTFTRENLRQCNFDAFFESGEPVYQLEQRQLRASTQSPENEFSGGGDPGGSSPYDTGGSATPGKSRLGLFHRNSNKSPLSGRSRSVEPESASNHVSQKDFLKSSSGAKRRNIFGWGEARSGSLGPQANMASYSGVLRDYGHSNLNETFKNHNNVTFKLVKTVSDFSETLSRLYEEHAAALQTLVSTFRKKNGEIRKERPACHSTLFQAWETFLQEIEADSQACSDVAGTLSRHVSRPMLDRSFHRKVQSRKIFTHRESFETIIAKTEDKLSKCRMDYKQAYMAHRQNPSQHTLAEYVDSHNAYVQQLQATNAMLETYHCDTIPQLMQELEEIYSDLCSIVAEAVMQGSDIISSKAVEQAKRYNSLTNQCQTVSPQQDLTHFIKILPTNQQKVPKRIFAPPQPAEGEDPADDNSLPPLRNELVIDRHSSSQLRTALESLKRESADLELQIRQLQDSVDTLIRNQNRGIENQLYNKANELQEDLSMKKFDLRAKQLQFTAIRAQKELFLPKSNPSSPQHAERKFLPAPSGPSMKTKWLKAFKSLKPASGYATGQPERRNGAAAAQPARPNEDGSHSLHEYTYKKITPCDVCSQILRGHTRQGLRCKICKLNAHADCASQLPKCQVKQNKLLRRQKSTSEIENRVDIEEEKITDIDQIYRVLKQAGEIKSNTDKIAQQQKNESFAPSIQQDIPIVNVPECPERRILPLGVSTGGRNRGPTYKPPPSTLSSNSAGKSGGLAAPTVQDMSSSDYRIPPNTIIGSNIESTNQVSWSSSTNDSTGLRRRLFAGFRPLSAFSKSLIGGRKRSPQHRSISLPETPHSPRRQKLNLRMKSLSLDSPESSELHGQIRRRQQHPTIAGPSYYQGGGSGGHLEHSTPPSNNSRLHSPSSPSHSRKLLYANRGLKSGSVDLPDEMEKSLSSASTSPCPSPVRQVQKSHRLLPTNLYVVLYNFKARHADELDLKAGYKVTVIDTSDPDWWKGKCLGRIGYFPSKYCTRLNAGEKPLQVTHNLQVSDGERGENMSLLRDQIVIQTADEVNGMVMVRSADNRQGYCPIKYLQEV